MTIATVSSKGQIAIPKAVRERLNLKPGTELEIDVQGEALVMKRTVRKYPDWRTMEGIQSSDPIEMRRQDWDDIRREAVKQFEARKSQKTA